MLSPETPASRLVVTTLPAPQTDFLAAEYTPPSSHYDLEPRWNLPALLAFRICFIYFGLYVITTQMLGGLIPIPGVDIPELAALPPMRNIYRWIAAHVMGIGHPIDITTTGSGDKLFHWVQSFSLLLFAIVGCAIWTARDRTGERDARIYKWFRIFLRFAVGTTLISYGFSKVIPLQMPTTMLSRLVEPYGNFSPMGVLWSSIGASPAYEVFVGCAEAAGGILLFFPRTATFGAMICLMDAIEIWMLNMTYDVPVKLLAFHLVLMSIFLLAPNLRRLCDFYLMHREVRIAPEPAVGRTPSARGNVVNAQIAFGIWAVAVTLYGAVDSSKKYGANALKPALYGIWDVDQMLVNGEVRAPLLTDSTRWKRIIFEYPTTAMFQRMGDNFKYYGSAIDTMNKTLTLSTFDSTKAKFPLRYQRPSPDQLVLDGSMTGQTVHFELKRRDPSKYMLKSRGFHWVSEFPFNR
jgi:hypothetical protein